MLGKEKTVHKDIGSRVTSNINNKNIFASFFNINHFAYKGITLMRQNARALLGRTTNVVDISSVYM